MQPTELKQLPDWLLEQLPQITEPAILSLRDTKLVVTLIVWKQFTKA